MFPHPPTLRILTDDERAWLTRFNSSLPAVGDCITCGGTGKFRWNDEDGQPAPLVCDCDSQRKASRYFLYHGVPLRYQRLTWSDTDGIDTEASRLVRVWLEQSASLIQGGFGLVLWSRTPGTGKTLLAVLLTKTLLVQGYDAHFTTFVELVDRFAASWGDEEARVWYHQRLMNVPVLVIDDLGREYKGQSLPEHVIEALVRHRTQQALPTIITTNRDPEAFQSAYGANLVSMVSEVARVIQVAGDDFRTKAKARFLREVDDGLTRPIAWW